MENIENYIAIAAGIAYGLTHIIAVLPPSVTGKIPNWLMQLLTKIAGNYKHAENLKTDSKGNLR